MDCFLCQHIEIPTRGDNILDLVLSSDPNRVSDIEDIGKLGSSDHILISCKLHIKNVGSSSVQVVPDWKKANLSQMKHELQIIDWEVKFSDTTEESWCTFKDILNDCITRHVPFKPKRNTKSKKLWITREVINIVRKKKRLWRKFKVTRELSTYIKYKDAELHVKRLLKDSVKKFEKKIASNIKVDPKSFYKYVKSKRQVKDNIGPLKDSNGRTSSEKLFMAETLNKFFAEIFTNENTRHIPDPVSFYRGDDKDKLNSCVITPEIVHKHLQKLKPNKASGPDGLGSNILKDLCEVISTPLSMLFNQSLRQCYVPSDWKTANVSPIFKKGTKSDPGNYRPISLTSLVGKCMESVLRDEIRNHLNRNKLIIESQHGFTEGRSCLTNLLLFLEDVTSAIDNGNPLDTVYLDFSKAFDKVPHLRLCRKIEAHGISGCVKNWIQNWLSNRTQRVVLDGIASSDQPVKSGVPQGSVLGPILFVIFINDIDTCIQSKLKKIADDSKVYRELRSEEDYQILQEDVENLCQWSDDWEMLFNIKKCKVLHFGFNNPSFNYHMKDEVLFSDSTEKDLGVHITTDLKSSKQCSEAVKKANQVLGMINRHFVVRDKNTIIQLYKSLVRPNLEYCIQVWSPHYKKDVNLIERVQRRATRMIEGLENKTYQERLKECNLTTLELRRHRGDLIETFKILTDREGFDKCKLFTLHSQDRTRGHSLKLVKPRSRLNCRKFFYSQRIINSWNQLPDKVIQATSVNNFKNLLDSYLKEKYGVSMSQSLLIPGPHSR